jgi:hypothetical protein
MQDDKNAVYTDSFSVIFCCKSVLQEFWFYSFFLSVFNSLLLMPTPWTSTQRHEENILHIKIRVPWEVIPCSLVDTYPITQHHKPEDSKLNILKYHFTHRYSHHASNEISVSNFLLYRDNFATYLLFHVSLGTASCFDFLFCVSMLH